MEAHDSERFDERDAACALQYLETFVATSSIFDPENPEDRQLLGELGVMMAWHRRDQDDKPTDSTKFLESNAPIISKLIK